MWDKEDIVEKNRLGGGLAQLRLLGTWQGDLNGLARVEGGGLRGGRREAHAGVSCELWAVR